MSSAEQPGCWGNMLQPPALLPGRLPTFRRRFRIRLYFYYACEISSLISVEFASCYRSDHRVAAGR